MLSGKVVGLLVLLWPIAGFDVAVRPFSVVWEVPAQGCQRRNITFDLERFGIVSNGGDDEAFNGGNITIFYGDQLGAWPELGAAPKNGGIPQLGNLSAHLAKAARDIDTLLPDPAFDGLGIVDWEAWRVLFSLNFDSLSDYQEASINLTKKQHPNWTNTSQIRLQAETEFNSAARQWFEQTLALLHKL